MLFYLPDFSLPVLPETEARHALQVLRLNAGDDIDLSDGKGKRAKAKILEAKAGNCSLALSDITETSPLTSAEIHLAVAPTKNADRMEWLVEKGTELGCRGFHFFRSSRTERNHLNLERMERIALSAMKQSGQYFLPEMHWYKKPEDLPMGSFDRIVIADLSARENRLQQIPCNKMLMLIGPEGDFTESELSWLSELKTESIRFLPQVLRTETAALYALSLALLTAQENVIHGS